MAAAPVSGTAQPPPGPPGPSKPLIVNPCAQTIAPGSFNRWLSRRLRAQRQLGYGKRPHFAGRPVSVCRWRALTRKTRRVERCLRSPACYWRRLWRRLAAPDRAWAHATGSCESGNVASRHDSAGDFHGAFQFTLATAQAAGFDRDPHTTPWHEQAVRAVRWRNIAGRGQWPVCG